MSTNNQTKRRPAGSLAIDRAVRGAAKRPRSGRRLLRHAATAAFSALLAAGCFERVGPPPLARNKPSQLALPKPGPTRVAVDSRWVYSTQDRATAEQILDRARKSAAVDGVGLDRLVQRWPDAVLDLLRDGIAEQTDAPLRLSIAAAYDQAFACANPESGWTAALAASASQHQAYAAFSQARRQTLALFQSGHLDDAMKINLVARLPSNAPSSLRAEALRVAGLAALLDEKPDRAAELLGQAAASAQSGSRHALFEIRLLLSETERRRGRGGAWGMAWQSAVGSAENVRDPDLWERAILAKPDDVEWPAAAGLGDAEPVFGAGPDTGDVLIRVGKMRLSRGALQPALLAFSRAEQETAVEGKRALARLYRTQTMIAVQQPASALPMLDELIKFADPRIVRRAQAVEGDVLCRVLDDRLHGIPMMRDALDESDDWPGKSRLLANLGLYFLLDGRDEEGLRCLHEAQAQFESTAQWDDLADALANEADYLRAAGKAEEAKPIQKRADETRRKAAPLA